MNTLSMECRDSLNQKLHSLKGYLVDMDGVLYHGRTPFPYAVQAWEELQEHGDCRLLTNNSTKERDSLLDFLHDLGFSVQPEQLILVNDVVQDYLLTHHAKDKILILGEKHLAERLKASGLEVIPHDQWDAASCLLSACSLSMNHDMLSAGLNLLLKGASFIASNPDLTVNADKGIKLEAGAYSGLLSTLSGREPIVIGKPERICYDYALKLLNLPADEVAMIGDNPDTDLLGAKKNGLFGIQVLSGLSTESHPYADLCLDHIGKLSAQF